MTGAADHTPRPPSTFTATLTTTFTGGLGSVGRALSQVFFQAPSELRLPRDQDPAGHKIWVEW